MSSFRRRLWVTAHGRDLHQPRLAAALALIGSVAGKRDEPLLREPLSVEARRLFLHAAERVGDDDRSIPAAGGDDDVLAAAGVTAILANAPPELANTMNHVEESSELRRRLFAGTRRSFA